MITTYVRTGMDVSYQFRINLDNNFKTLSLRNCLTAWVVMYISISYLSMKIMRKNELFLTENNQVKEAGLYELIDADNGQALQSLAFNYNRNESDVELLEPEEIKNLFAAEGIKVYEKSDIPLNTLIKQEENGKPLWRLFIRLALLFIAIEILLLRFWKNTQPTPSPALS